MKFQQARLEDTEKILQINQKYLRKNHPDISKGFLLGEQNEQKISENLENYYVAKEDQSVLGYAEIAFTIPKEDFPRGRWENELIRRIVLDKIKNNEFIYLIQLASDEQKKGVGTYLIDKLLEIFRDSIILSFVAFQPYFNEVSWHFHENAKFQRVGTFKIKLKFGIPGYTHICYVRIQ